MIAHGRWQRIVAVIVFGVCASGLWAAETTTSSLVVNGDSEFRGDLRVADASTGSATTNGLVLYYSFSTNTTPVADDSGNGHTGTVSGATWVTNGQSEGAYSFDGTGDYITVTGYKGILGSNAASVSLWFKTSATLSTYPILYFWGQDTVLRSANYAIFFPDGYLHFTRVVTGFDILSLGNSLNDSTWHHMVTTYDGTNSCLYIDSVFQGSHNDGALSIASNQDVRIGNYKDNSDPAHYLLNGLIDEFRIYSRALSVGEVDGLYLHDAHLKVGSTTFETSVTCKEGVNYVKPLGDILMGVYTNSP